MLLVYPLSAPRIVGTDLLHAALLLWVAGAGHLLHGNVDLHAMAWLLVGSIPGVLVGSHLSVRVPERALRIAFAFVLMLSGIKLVGVPAATLIIEVCLGARRGSRCRLAARCSCGQRRLAAAHDARVESLARGPGPVDGGRPRPARGDCCCLRDHGGSEAREVADRGHARRPVFSPAARSGQRTRTSSSGCGRGSD